MIGERPGLSSVLSVLAATSLWGLSGPAEALARTGASPAAGGAARLLVGGVVLGTVALASGASVRSWLGGRDWPWLGVAAASTGVFQPAFFAAIDRTGAGVATLVALGAAPAVTGTCARLQGEPLRRGWVAATSSAIVGCSLLLLPGGTGDTDALGIVFALLAACCYAGYTVALKRLLQAERQIEGVIAASLLGGAAFLLPAFTMGAFPLLSLRGLLLTTWLGIASTALAYLLFVRGLRTIAASTVGTLSLAEPLVAVGVGALPA